MGFTNIRVLLLLREGEERNGLEGTLAESVTFFFNIWNKYAKKVKSVKFR